MRVEGSSTNGFAAQARRAPKSHLSHARRRAVFSDNKRLVLTYCINGTRQAAQGLEVPHAGEVRALAAARHTQTFSH